MQSCLLFETKGLLFGPLPCFSGRLTIILTVVLTPVAFLPDRREVQGFVPEVEYRSLVLPGTCLYCDESFTCVSELSDQSRIYDFGQEDQSG